MELHSGLLASMGIKPQALGGGPTIGILTPWPPRGLMGKQFADPVCFYYFYMFFVKSVVFFRFGDASGVVTDKGYKITLEQDGK